MGIQEPKQEPLLRAAEGKRTEPPALVWAAVAVPALFHFAIAVGHVSSGKISGQTDGGSIFGGLGGWIARYYGSAGRGITDNQSVFAIWILALLGYAIYATARREGPLVEGVGMFLRNLFAVVVILAIATPAVWVVFGSSGSKAVEFVAPVVLTLGGIFIIRGAAPKGTGPNISVHGQAE